MPKAAIWMYVRATLRARPATWVFLVVAIGLAAGASMAAVAGGDRTLAAFPQFVAEANAADLYMASDCVEPAACRSVVAEVGALPAVAAAGAMHLINPEFLTADGRAITPTGDPCLGGSGEVDLLLAGERGGFGAALNRLDVRDGRVPDPTRADEVMIAGDVARRAGLHVGDQISMAPGCQDSESPMTKRRLTIVGIEESVLEAHGDVGFYISGVHGTTALLRELVAERVRMTTFVAARLAPHANVAAFEAQVSSIAGAGPIVVQTADTTRDFERSVRPEATTLWLIGALLGLAAAVVLGSSLARRVLAEAPRLRLLHQLGFTRRDFAAAAVILSAVISLGAVAVGIVFAIGGSRLMPFGQARRFEPEIGLHVDPRTLIVGAAATLVLVLAITTAAILRAAAAQRPRARPGSIVERLVASGRFRPGPAAGLRMAFARPTQSAALALRCGLFGLVIGLAGVVAAVTFVAGVDHLGATQRLVGVNWDAQVGQESEAEHDLEDLHDALHAAASVERASLASFFSQPQESIVPGQSQTRVMSFTSGAAAVTPTVIRGRAPRARNEILLNPRLAARVGVRVGQRMELLKAGSDPPAKVPYEVVGIGVVPIGDGRLETGFALTFEGFAQVFPDAKLDLALVSFRRGSDPSDLARDLEAAGFDRNSFSIETRPDFEPLANIDLDEVKRAPRILGVLVALMGVGVLIHTTISAARCRRRELAVHRALGFTRRQMYSATTTQAAALVATALVLAVPLGILGGVVAFNVYAQTLGAAPEAAISWTAVAFIAVASLACAVVAVLPNAFKLARTPTTEALRAD